MGDSEEGEDAVAVSYNTIFKWPKVELHAHLNGCIREETLFELAKERNVTMSSHHFARDNNGSNGRPPAPAQSVLQQIDKPNKMYNVSPRSLQDCFDMFAEIPKAVDDLPALRRITREALLDFAAHSVAYLELRTTPKRLLVKHNDGNGNDDQATKMAEKQTYLETVVQVMREFEQEEEERYQKQVKQQQNQHAPIADIRLPLVCRLIVAVDRGRSLEEAAENVQLAIDMANNRTTTNHDDDNKDSYIVGLDLGGNPTKQDFRLFQPLFEQAREQGLKITLHTAEIPCSNSNNSSSDDKTSTPSERRARQEVQAILQFAPDRLGHALLLPKDLGNQLLNDDNDNDNSSNRRKRIPIETCPTSNVMTLELATAANGDLVQALRRHHPSLQQWIQAGYPLAISTDDPGVFCTTATQELVLVQQALDMDLASLQQVVWQSLEYAFCSEAVKERIRNRWREKQKDE